MLYPIEKEIRGKKFTLYKFPAVEGREIVSNYSHSGMAGGDYKLNEAMMLKMMCYVAVNLDGGALLKLTTRELVNNHAGDWEVLAEIEKEMMKYNCSFFKPGQS